MSKITNNTNIDLTMAVWLVNDLYDIKSSISNNTYEEEFISATTLLKPLKQLVLGEQVNSDTLETDVVDLIAISMGNAIHSDVERAWRYRYVENLTKLGISENFISKIRINPTKEDYDSNNINVFLEKRFFKKLDDFIISGQADIIFNGSLKDIKTTSVYSFMDNAKDEDYILQGSIYRWLASDLITSDILTIQFVFTDWQSYMTKQNPNYPPYRVASKEFKLLSLEDTEKFILTKIRNLVKYRGKSEEDIPPCSSKELWLSDTQYKYYSDPSKVGQLGSRATKNFVGDRKQAYDYMASKGCGTIIEVPGEAKACRYCKCFDICKQKDQYYASGSI